MEGKTQVLVVGLGAIGSVHAFFLQRGEKCSVTGVVRSSYQAIQDHGLTFHSKISQDCAGWRPDHLVASVEEAESLGIAFDYVIVATKALPSVHPITRTLAPLLDPLQAKGKPLPVIVLIQNGLGIEHELYQAYPDLIILSCSAWTAISQVAPTGKDEPLIIDLSSYMKLVVGLYDPTHDPFLDGKRPQARLEQNKAKLVHFAALLNEAGCKAEIDYKLWPGRWQKILWSATYAVLCTLSRSSVQRLLGWDTESGSAAALDGQYNEALVERAMHEVVQVAQATGLSSEDIGPAHIEKTIQITMSMKNNLRRNDQHDDLGYMPSMTLDAIAGRPMESQVILGSVVQLAQKFGLPIPILSAWYAALSTLNAGFILKAQ